MCRQTTCDDIALFPSSLCPPKQEILASEMKVNNLPVLVKGQVNESAVTTTSVVNALHDMVVQGLYPSQMQCYFIAYGKTLTMQRSVYGDIALASRIDPNLSLYYDYLYEGEELLTTKKPTSIGLVNTLTAHNYSYPRNTKALLGVYVGLCNKQTKEDYGIEFMDMDRIKKSWSMSKTYKPDNPDCTHNKFTEEMALRTAIRHRLKHILRSATEIELAESIKRTDDEYILATEDAISVKAEESLVNSLEPAIEGSAIEFDAETGEVIEAAPVQAQQTSEAPF
jgi:recombination protein RecT